MVPKIRQGGPIGPVHRVFPCVPRRRLAKQWGEEWTPKELPSLFLLRQVETGWVRSNPLLYIRSTWTDYELMLLENSGMMLTGWMSDNPDHALKCVRWWPIGGYKAGQVIVILLWHWKWREKVIDLNFLALKTWNRKLYCGHYVKDGKFHSGNDLISLSSLTATFDLSTNCN